MEHKLDRELEEFRKIMDVPSTFEEGFKWSSLFGAIFVALLMVPGAIYMGLLAGTGIGSAAQWVTVILFIEVARRAHKYLNKSEIFVLFFMAGSMMGAATTGGLLWQQFFAQSDAAAANGLTDRLVERFSEITDFNRVIGVNHNSFHSSSFQIWNPSGYFVASGR